MTKEDIVSQIEPYLKTEPGLAYNFTQPIAMRVDELTSGVKSDLAVKIYGEDLNVLSRIGESISKLLPNLNGTDNFYVEQTVGQPYVTIEIDRAAVASFGLNVNDVQKIIEAGIGGQEVSQLYEGQRRFGIVARYPEDIRNQLHKIQDVPVHLPNGDFVPLKRVANIVLQEGPREFNRRN
jgi:cobalt-zinc-cadmium resistance protein CzcA